MLATLAALQLVVLSQVAPPPKEITPQDAAPAESTLAPAEGGPASNPPLPRKFEPSPDAAAPPSPGTPTPPRRPTQLSLLSGESLGGGSTALAWVGWSSLGLAYAQGITERDDLAGFADYDYTSSELRLGAFYRRPLGKAGDFDMAGRLSAAWYLNFGAKYFHDDNHSDSGVEVVPGLSLSKHAAGGIFSGIAEAALTVTTNYDAGFLFTPRVSVAYEAPLYPELTVGARFGVGYRAGSGDAPLADGHAEVAFLVLASYQLL